MKFKCKMLGVFLTIAVVAEARGIEEAEIYHKNSGPQWKGAMERIYSIPWTGREHVLDVGSGNGAVTALISETFTVGNVIGLDVSESMVRFASSKYPSNLYPNLSFLVGDAACLPFDSQFDVVVSFSALHWVIDQKAALEGILRSLVPGGRACLLTYVNANTYVPTVAEELIASEKWASYFPGHTKLRVYLSEEEYRTLLESVGFEHIDLTVVWQDNIFPDRKAFYDFTQPLVTFSDHLSPELKHEFIEDVIDKIISSFGARADGSILYRLGQLRVSAVKSKESNF